MDHYCLHPVYNANKNTFMDHYCLHPVYEASRNSFIAVIIIIFLVSCLKHVCWEWPIFKSYLNIQFFFVECAFSAFIWIGNFCQSVLTAILHNIKTSGVFSRSMPSHDCSRQEATGSAKWGKSQTIWERWTSTKEKANDSSTVSHVFMLHSAP